MRYSRNLQKARRAKARAVLNILPKPPVENGECACGCSHVPVKGACPDFRLIDISSDRCRVCDHAIVCHRRKGEPPPKDWDFPSRFTVEFLMRFAPPNHPQRRKPNEKQYEWIERLRLYLENQIALDKHRKEIRAEARKAVNAAANELCLRGGNPPGPCDSNGGGDAGEIPASGAQA